MVFTELVAASQSFDKAAEHTGAASVVNTDFFAELVAAFTFVERAVLAELVAAFTFEERAFLAELVAASFTFEVEVVESFAFDTFALLKPGLKTMVPHALADSCWLLACCSVLLRDKGKGESYRHHHRQH
jgi:hypothetical protein